MTVEKRRHPRIPTRIVVKFISPKAFVEEFTENISHGGLFLKTANCLPVQTIIRILLCLPASEIKMEISAMVVHVSIGEDGVSSGMGVHFTDLTDDQFTVIKDYAAQASGGGLKA